MIEQATCFVSLFFSEISNAFFLQMTDNEDKSIEIDYAKMKEIDMEIPI